MKKSILTIGLVAMATVVCHAQGYTTLGIGINNPQGTLHVHSSQVVIPPIPPSPDGNGDDTTGIGDVPRFIDEFNTLYRMTNNNTGTSSTDGFVIDQFNYNVTLQQYEEGNLTLRNHNAQLILSPNGKVGIGAVNSGYHFNVSGSANITSSLHVGYNMTVGNSMVVSNTLNVGNGFYCDVNGNLMVKSLWVTLSGWSDYVFDDDYRLMPLGEVERYINSHRHLPDVPSAAEVEENGVDVGEMNKILLQKVEELTLYVIDLQKQIDDMKSNR